MKAPLFIFIVLIFCCNVTLAQLPVWPLVTGFPQSGATANTTGTTPHQYVDWTSTNPSSLIIPGTGSNRMGPTQAGINGCNELEFFTLHNGEFVASAAALEIYTPTGTYLGLPGGDMNASAGDDEIQIVRRPGNSSQWFVIYNLAPNSYPYSNPGYQACNLAYSLIEVNAGTASYVLDALGNPIQDRILSVSGSNYQYFNGKATSRTSVVVGYDHDIYVQRRTQSFGSSNISATFQVDRFSISNQDEIVHTGSSSVVNGYTWGLMGAGSSIEFSPAENSLAVMARTQNNNQQEIYLFDPANLAAAPNTIRISDLWIEFNTPPTGLTGLFHQASSFDFNNGTGHDWLRNFERKVFGLEYSPNGDYLYISGGGYVAGATQNLTYLTQIDLNQTISGNHVARVQVQTTNSANTYNNNTGAGNTWSTGNLTNAYLRSGIGRIQSSYDGNLYFTKGNSQELFVIPDPDSPLPIQLTPGNIDLSTPQWPNIPTNGFVGILPDQIDGFNYFAVNSNNGALIEALTNTVVSGDTLYICSPNSVNVIANWASNLDYQWNTGAITQQITLSQQGMYTVDISENGCLMLSDTVYVEAGTTSIDLGPDTSFCSPGTLLLDPGVTNASYLWQDGSTQATYSVTSTGSYAVTVDNNGCVASDTIQVTVLPGTNPQLGADTLICDINATIVYDVNEPNASYVWQDSSTNASFTVTSSGTYWVESSINTCTSSDTVNVTIAEQPEIDLGNDTIICGPIQEILVGTCTYCDYQWSNGATTSEINITSPGVYYAIANNFGCTDSDTIEFIQYFAPDVFISDIELCELGQELVILNESGATYQWQDSSTSNNYIVQEPGMYSVVVTNFCGVDTAVFEAITIECFCDIYVPNTFTPNGDEFNQGFHVYTDCDLQSFTFEIFNRWGEIIFTSYDIDFFWDGTYNGRLIPDGTYVWKMEYTFEDMVPKERIGHVNIFR